MLMFEPQSSVSLNKETWPSLGRLSVEDNEFLTRPFSEDEVKNVIFSMKENSAPGPDGFGVTFYKSCWEIIKKEFMEMVNDFHKGGGGGVDLDPGVGKIASQLG